LDRQKNANEGGQMAFYGLGDEITGDCRRIDSASPIDTLAASGKCRSIETDNL